MDYEDYMEDVKSFAFLRDDSQENGSLMESSPGVSNGANLSLGDPEKIPPILNGDYFQIVEEIKGDSRKTTGIIAVCQLCIKRRSIKGSLKVTSNFIQHLKNQHPIQYEEYIEDKRRTSRRSRPDDAPDGGATFDEKMLQHRSLPVVDPLSAADNSKDVSFPSAAPVEVENVPTIFNGRYFKIIEETKTEMPTVSTIVALCQVCGKRKWIQGNLSMTSNFVRHFKTMHPEEHAQYLVDNGNVKRVKLEEQDSSSYDDATNAPHISETLAAAFSGSMFEPPSLNYSQPNYLNQSSSTELDEAPTIINGKYFRIVQEHQTEHQQTKSVTAACQMCTSIKYVRGTLGVSSNFLRHLKEFHALQYEEYCLEKKIAKQHRCLRSSYSNFDERVLRFIVETFSALTIVEQPSFVRLFEGTGLRVNTAKHMLNMLHEKFSVHVDIVRDTLRLVPYVCTTADIWTVSRHSFIGYACHWIDSNLKRQSAALCCTRRPGMHAVRKVAMLIEQTNMHYALNAGKILYTFTDNGGNFLNDAFKEADNREHENNEDANANEEITFLPYPADLKLETPKQYTCSSHGLNMLATTDFHNILKADQALYKVHLGAFERCNSVWSKYREEENDEIVANVLGCCLKLPNATSWNSFFDALSHLLAQRSKLDELCSALGIPKLTDTDLEYVDDYCCVMRPISDGLQFLQKEENMYYGYFLPMLITIKIKLQKLQATGNLKHLNRAVDALKQTLIERFRNFYEVNEQCYDALVAAVSCPSIKLKFLPALKDLAPSITQETITEIFINHAKEFDTTGGSGDGDPKGASTSGALAAPDALNSFFDFSLNDDALIEQQKHSLYKIRLQLLQYLGDGDCSRQCLDRYPIIRKTFIKYNTPLPSSAAVERLFEFDADVCDQMFRHNLPHHLFERMAILKANKAFC